MQKAAETINEKVGSAVSTIKTRLHLDDAMERLHVTKEYLLEAAIYAGVGFVAGYLLKRFSGVVAIVILTIASIALLQHFDLVGVMINWEKIQDLIGIDPEAVLNENFFAIVWLWIKTHVLLAVSFVVAFLLGLKCA